MVHIHNRTVFNNKKWNCSICRKMDGIGKYFVTRSQSGLERRYILTLVEPRFKIIYAYICSIYVCICVSICTSYKTRK